MVDQGVATTTGIAASMPLALTLIEAIAGRDKAEAVGREIGVTQWDWPAEHPLPAIGARPPAEVLDDALRGITTRYGRAQPTSSPYSSNIRGRAHRSSGAWLELKPA